MRVRIQRRSEMVSLRRRNVWFGSTISALHEISSQFLNPPVTSNILARTWLFIVEGRLRPGAVMGELQALIRNAIADDRTQAERHEAFGKLVLRFQDLAFGCAYAVLGDFYLAQDAAQESFITAWRKLYQLKQAEAFPG